MRILTFDLEDWFHLLDFPETADPQQWDRFESRFESSLRRIQDMLQRRRQSATFFCLGWIAERYPEAIRRLSEMGFEIGSHSHVHSLVYRQTPDAFERELVHSLDALEAVTGRRPRIFRAPGFSITNQARWAFGILAKHGIEVDCSVFPTRRAHGGMPTGGSNLPYLIGTQNGLLKCFPMNTAEIFGYPVVFTGGGYFRILPTSVIRVGVRQAPYVMTYFHPRDFDPGQPVLAGLGFSRRFRAYVGIDGAMAKLERLLDLGGFDDIRMAERSVDWNQVPLITA